jgi:ATP-dependent Lon protease
MDSKNTLLKKRFSDYFDSNLEKKLLNQNKKNKLSIDYDSNINSNTNSNTNSIGIIESLTDFNNNNESNFTNLLSSNNNGIDDDNDTDEDNGDDEGDNGDDGDDDGDDGDDDGDSDEDEDEDEDKDEDDKDEEEDDDNKKYKINISNYDIKSEDIKYFSSSDSSDSENEIDILDPKKFSLNLLKKIQRHNSKEKPDEIAKKFNSKVINMDKKYKKYSKNPSKYKNLRQFYKNLSECKNLYNLIMDDIEYYKNKFNFNKFFGKYNNDKNYDNNNDRINTNEPNIFDIFFETVNNQRNSSNSVGSKLDNEFKDLYDKDNKSHQSGLKYFRTLDKKLKLDYINKLKKINNQMDLEDKRPNYMKVLDMEMDESNKSLILQRIQQMEGKQHGDAKLKNWINKIMNIPFGVYVKPPVNKSDSTEKIKDYLNGVRKILDSEVYGHQATKDQLVKILAHTITNPQEGGNVFALQGPPGIGKTALIQDGISKALGRPFAFISLGGATDASFLEGHDFTYEGSQHGRIVDILQQTKCMNPVIYFDELDKVSETAKGDEIINILMHLTDSTQNSHFNDKYFGGINFDLSKAIIIFSFNEEHKISRILRDRMKIIRVKGYKMLDKINIARDYLIPKLIKQIGLNDIKLNISDKLLEFMIETYTNEGGVRKLKELLNDIFLEINLRKLEGNNDWVTMNNYSNHKNKNKKRGRVTITPNEITLIEEMIEKDFLKKNIKLLI